MHLSAYLWPLRAFKEQRYMGELWNATAWPITSNWPKFPTHFPATHARKYIPLHSFSWVVDIPDLWPGGYTFTECCGLHNTTVIEQSKRLSFGQTGALNSRGQLKCDGTRAENKFRLSAKRTSPFKSPGWGGGFSSVDCWQPRCVHQW